MTTYFKNTKGYTPVSAHNYGDCVKVESHNSSHHTAVFYDDYNNELRRIHYTNLNKQGVINQLHQDGFEQDKDSLF